MLVDLFVWAFYFSKGFLGAKIKAEMDIRRNKVKIEKRYHELENMKKIPDVELIRKFQDKIFVQTIVSQNFFKKLFVRFLEHGLPPNGSS